MWEIRVKRVYEPSDSSDGFRVLVDRLWPRGLTRERVNADLWLKDAAPSTALRQWYHHDLAQWDEFRRRYFLELDNRHDALRALLDAAAAQPLTLLYSSRDPALNQAIALREYLLEKFG